MENVSLYCGDCLEIMPQLDAKSVDLIVADPPYFKVISQKWDFNWKSIEDYMEWCVDWMTECYRSLRIGGSFYLFGYFRTLCYLVPELEKIGFELRQQIVINKGIQAVSGRHTKPYKMFPNVTESILFLYKNPRPFARKLLKNQQKELGIKSKDINEALGVKSNGGGMWSIYTGKNICEQLPTKENWNKLEKILKFKYPYEKIAITFNPQLGLTDVWDDIDFYQERKKRERLHPTQKPENLISRLILASSNFDNLVLDPFMGSGSTGVACVSTGRRFIGIEKEKNYFDLAKKRIEGVQHERC